MRADAVTRALRGGLALATIAGGLVLLDGPAPAYANNSGDKIFCSELATDSGGGAPDIPKPKAPPVTVGPSDIMGVEAAQQLVGSPGSGVTIALIDSGVAGGARTPKFPGPSLPVTDNHGTVSAGLIRGIAKGADLASYAVWKPEPQNGEGMAEVYTDAEASALKQLAAGPTRHLIVSVSLAINEDLPKAKAAVAALIAKGAIVVSAANIAGENKATGIDTASQVFPAAYPGVVTASASHTQAGDFTTVAGGQGSTVLPNSNTDVAAPVFGAASRTLFGKDCWVDSVNTGWAAAEVSAVLALIWSKYPQLPADQVIDRLYRTASGRVDSGGRFTGAGVVDAYDAVNHPAFDDPKVKVVPVKEAELGKPPADVLESVRRHAVWWGLGGGGALGLGLIMRPLFSRRKNG